jgi:hypothetical protein
VPALPARLCFAPYVALLRRPAPASSYSFVGFAFFFAFRFRRFASNCDVYDDHKIKTLAKKNSLSLHRKKQSVNIFVEY